MWLEGRTFHRKAPPLTWQIGPRFLAAISEGDIRKKQPWYDVGLLQKDMLLYKEHNVTLIINTTKTSLDNKENGNTVWII